MPSVRARRSAGSRSCRARIGGVGETTREWSLARRVLFRFGVVVAVAQILPFPLDLLPKTDWLTSRYADLWNWLLRGFGDVIGAVVPSTEPTGSGDTTAAWVGFAMQLAIGVAGAAIWSAIDERRQKRAYPRAARWTFTALRYWLAFAMFGYGLAKLFHVQFGSPRLATLDRGIGQLSPMALLWTFMGYSWPYTVFAGLGECLGGALLLWRRTTTLGALILIPILVNVVMLNFCYDVPVKLYSSTLLVVAGVLAAPDLVRVLAVVLGRAVPARQVAPPRSSRVVWLSAMGKLVLVVLVVGVQATDLVDARDERAQRSPLQGLYDVESERVDGVEAAGDARWRRVIFEGASASVRASSDEITRYGAELDEAKHTVVLARAGNREVYAVTRPAPDRLVLDGAHLHVVLRARDPDAFPLMTRGFHWIQEAPYNR